MSSEEEELAYDDDNNGGDHSSFQSEDCQGLAEFPAQDIYSLGCTIMLS